MTSLFASSSTPRSDPQAHPALSGAARERTLLRLLRLMEIHPAASLRAGLLHLWAESQRVDLSSMRSTQGVNIISSEISHEKAEATKDLRTLLPPAQALTLKDLESVLEVWMGDAHRRSLGVVYTPDYITRSLITGALDLLSRSRTGDPAKAPVLVDPFCGSGAFLLEGATLLEKRYHISPDRIFAEHIVGFDLDSGALANARLLITLYLLQKGFSASSSAPLRLLKRDTILEQPESLWEAAGLSDGFPLITTNPPYVKLQNLTPSYREQLLERYPEFASGSFSLAMLSPVVLHRLLSEEGVAALITQNNLFTSLAATRVRKYLQETQALRRILDFGGQQIFSSASAYTCLLYLGKSGVATDSDGSSFEYEMLRSKASPESLSAVEFSTQETSLLDERKWKLAPGKHLDALHKIESAGQTLKEIANIRVGFATLKDSIFMVKEEDEGELKGLCTALTPSFEKVVLERESVKEAFKVSALSSESDILDNRTRIIFPYRRSVENGRFEIIPEDELSTRWPGTYRYLLSHREILKARDKGAKSYPAWYAWGRTQGMEAPGPKLLTKTFSQGPRFFLDTSDALFCNGYALSLKKEISIPLVLLQRILNSSIMHYYATLSSVHLSGNYQCYQKNFIEPFGVPILTKEESTHLLSLSDEEFETALAAHYQIHLPLVKEYLQEIATLGNGESAPTEETEGER